MRKVELLAPAGDKESLIAAIQNGADAIYLGGTLFNARASAKNFDHNDLIWAVQYAHLRDVKIYVTVNILYKDDEFDELIHYLDFLYDIQVDALIVQDLGLFEVIKERYKDFEIHISTQASVMNKYSADYFKKNGASRVVLARENTIDEIRDIACYTDIELEVFVHGALCMAYSGQCLMSSMIGKRSGNRGKCAQPCRLEYSLKEDGILLNQEQCFLLSPKDLMTIDYIGELIDVGVTSFKIEGRMKKPEYVAAVVNAYRKAIDDYLLKEKNDLLIEKENMKQMFNRDYTKGYLFNDSFLSDGAFSGHRGVVIGKVLSYNNMKKRVQFKLFDSLKQGDSVLFESIDKGRPINKMYINNKLVNIGHKNDIVEIEFDYKVTKGIVRKTIDNDLVKNLQLTYHKEFKKNSVNMIFEAKEDEYAYLNITYQEISIDVQSDILCQKAIKTPLSKERIEKQLMKLGDTPFYLKECQIIIQSDISLPIKTINEMRRQAIEKLIYQLENKKIHHFDKKEIDNKKRENSRMNKTIDVYVSNMEQLIICMNYPIRTIYYPYSKDSLKAIQKCKENNKDIALFIPRITKNYIIDEIIESQSYKCVNKVVVNDMGSYQLMKDKEIILGTGLNIYNSYHNYTFDKDCILSLEMDLKQINNISIENKIIEVYGKVENMISEFCPITQYYHGRQIKQCQKCKNHIYSLVDRKKEEFDILVDEQCRMHLLNSKPIYFDDLSLLNANHYLVFFTNEKQSMVNDILNDYFEFIIKDKKSEMKKQIEYTNGYLQ